MMPSAFGNFCEAPLEAGLGELSALVDRCRRLLQTYEGVYSHLGVDLKFDRERTDFFHHSTTVEKIEYVKEEYEDHFLIRKRTTGAKWASIYLKEPISWQPIVEPLEAEAAKWFAAKPSSRGSAYLIFSRAHHWPWHVDKFTHRLHVPLAGADSHFFAWQTDGEEEVRRMRDGFFYLIKTDIPHRTFSQGGEQRVHLMLDMELKS
jgi:hypothetical protein